MFLVSTITWVLPFVLFVIVAIMASDGGIESKPIMPMIVITVVSLITAMVITTVWILWLIRKGDYGPNKYGPDPRQVTSTQASSLIR